MLTIQEYNKNEIMGRINLSNRFLRAFRAGLFEKGGFPTVIYDEKELVRYIDSQHAECFESYYYELCKGLTKEECNSVLKMTEKVFNYTKNTYKKEFLVKAAILDAVFCKRLIESLKEKQNDVCVMEIGAGSGILGGLLLQEGYKYVCTDVTQAFYLMQNRLFSLFCDDIKEYAADSIAKGEAKCVHIPYWKLWDMRNQEGEIDIVTCNHALLEMHENAVKFYLKMAKNLMKNSKVGYFVIRSFGWNVERSLVELLNDFENIGYKLKYFDYNKQIAIYGLQGESVYKEVTEMLISPNYQKNDKYIIYGLGMNSKSEITDGIAYTKEEGQKIQNYMNGLKKEMNIKKLNEEYNKLTKNQDSPDEEFGKYVKI